MCHQQTFANDQETRSVAVKTYRFKNRGYHRRYEEIHECLRGRALLGLLRNRGRVHDETLDLGRQRPDQLNTGRRKNFSDGREPELRITVDDGVDRRQSSAAPDSVDYRESSHLRSAQASSQAVASYLLDTCS